MICQDLTDSFELYCLGALDGPERDAIDEHIGRNCEKCMAQMNRALENNALIFSAVPQFDPPKALRSRILSGFGLETRPFWMRAMPWTLTAAAVAAALVLSIVPLRRSAPETTATAIDFLATPGTRQVAFGKDGPHGSVLMQQDKGMLLVVVNLPAAPAGKMYETWIVPVKGAPRPTGQLTMAKNGNSVGLIPGPLNMASIQAVAVSVEPAGSQPVTPTTVLFAAPLGS